MIPNERLSQIAAELLDKTRNDNVIWNSAPGTAAKVFIVKFPNSEVHITYCSPVSDADWVRFDVCRVDGTVVGTQMAPEGTTNWPLLRDVFSEASRVALGWDKVLEDISRELQGNEIIGDQTSAGTINGNGSPVRFYE